MANVFTGFHFHPSCAAHLNEALNMDNAWEILRGENQKVTKTLERLLARRGMALAQAHFIDVLIINYVPGQPSNIHFVPRNAIGLQAAIAGLQNDERLVVAGHASQNRRFMWGAAPDVLVNFFTGNYAPAVDCRFSLYCCHAGDLERQNVQGQPPYRFIGWAKDFYDQMRAQNGQNYSVSARTGTVAVQANGNKVITSPTDINFYKVVMYGNDRIRLKRPNRRNQLITP